MEETLAEVQDFLEEEEEPEDVQEAPLHGNGKQQSNAY